MPGYFEGLEVGGRDRSVISAAEMLMVGWAPVWPGEASMVCLPVPLSMQLFHVAQPFLLLVHCSVTRMAWELASSMLATIRKWAWTQLLQTHLVPLFCMQHLTQASQTYMLTACMWAHMYPHAVCSACISDHHWSLGQPLKIFLLPPTIEALLLIPVACSAEVGESLRNWEVNWNSCGAYFRSVRGGTTFSIN